MYSPEDEQAGQRCPNPPGENDNQLNDELTSFLNTARVDFLGALLSWWCANRAKFPMLARVARKWLCSPATSTPSERVFSIAGIVDAPKRNRLNPSLLSAQVFCHNNYRVLADDVKDEIAARAKLAYKNRRKASYASRKTG